MGYFFEKHILYVNGAFSKISIRPQQPNSKIDKLELYNVYNEERFNKAMCLLLECVKGFMDFV
jgi:hypothetical protein